MLKAFEKKGTLSGVLHGARIRDVRIRDVHRDTRIRDGHYRGIRIRDVRSCGVHRIRDKRLHTPGTGAGHRQGAPLHTQVDREVQLGVVVHKPLEAVAYKPVEVVVDLLVALADQMQPQQKKPVH